MMENEIPETPITREEMYLNRIATGGGAIPEKPITRQEQYLDYIANHGGGADLPSTTNLIAGDGSGGATDSGIAAGDVALAEDLAAYRTAAEQDVIDGGLIPKSAQSTKTSAYTEPVGVDADGKLWSIPGSGGGGDTAGVVAPAYSQSVTYNEGDLVIYESLLYLAKQDISTPEEWDDTHWAQTTVDEMLGRCVKFATITVTCVTRDGVVVTGQTVTLRRGQTADSPVYETKAYDGQPVTFDVLPGFEYFVSVSSTLDGHFSPTTAHGLVATAASVTLTYEDVSHITTFDGLMDAIETIDDPSVLIGNVEIPDTWEADNGTVYDDPMILVDVKTVQDADGVNHLAGIVQRKWATLNSVQFDAPENEEATEETATDGLYYIGLSGSTRTKLTLAAGDSIPYSDYDKIFHNEINFDGNMTQYGYNRWSHSAYRQYLNSDAAASDWWTAQHIGDVAPSQANSIRGYMAGCSEALLAAAQPIKIDCNLNTVTDGGVMEATVDKFWLPSGIEMYGTSNAGEGTYFPYWKQATELASPSNGENAGRIQYALENHTSAQVVRCRSAVRGNSYNVWHVNSTGSLASSSNASTAYQAVPACAIFRRQAESI